MAEPNYLSPQEKLKNYYKSQAKKGATAVTTGTNKFTKDYIEPVAKLAGSFTHLGPLIGLNDAYNSYKAGVEVLPYVAGIIAGKTYQSEQKKQTGSIS